VSLYEDSRLTRWTENRLFKLDNGQVVAVSEDVTEKRALQAQVAQSDRLASVGLLAAGVAHEINNPLTYVLYNAEALTEDLQAVAEALIRAGPERAAAELLKDCAGRAAEAVEGAHRVKKIVRDLRTFSRVDEDRRVPVSLNEVIDGALTMAYNEVKYRARLVKDYAVLPTLLANEGKLAQVFLNLVVNAAHAIGEGDVPKNEIRIVTREEDGEVVAEVRDTGCGIPEAELARLFDPFFTTKQVGEGSGLGLSICHNIITGMGGSIEVESAEGEGACFRVRLPLTSAEPETSKMVEAPAVAATRGRFLIVDDEPHVAEAIKRLFEKEHDFVLATSGAGAREALKHDRSYDGIICDLMMPDVTGMDLHDWLEENEPRLARAMVFITGGAFTPRAKAFLGRVQNLALEKPFDLGTMRSWLHGRAGMED
jgi:signal transduction histidine kinase/CheY-like chemotaxis protein